MSILEGIRRHIRINLHGKKKMDDMEVQRKELDEQIDRILKATLNGDEQWFRELVGGNAECVGEILLRCHK